MEGRSPLFEQFQTDLREAAQELASLRTSAMLVDKMAGEELAPPYPDYPLGKTISETCKALEEIIKKDMHRYVVEKISQAKMWQQSSMHTQKKNQEEEQLAALLKEQQAAEDEPPAPSPDILYAEKFQNFFEPLRPPEPSDPDIVNREVLSVLKGAEHYLYELLCREVEEAIHNPSTPDGYSPNCLDRMKKTIQAIGGRRMREAITSLRNARRDDPHNHALSFMLSQILYFYAAQGKSEYLPEAREEAKRSCLDNERVNKNKLLTYRYHAISTERHFSAERALDLMREYYMLNPELLIGGEGLYINNLMHLKCWVILSTIPPSLWQKFEIESLLEVSRQAIFGVPLYLYFFRKKVADLPSDEDASYQAEFEAVEHDIFKQKSLYTALISGINNNFAKDGSPKEGGKNLWTVPTRYLKTLLSTSPPPVCDNILMYTSLDGRNCLKDIPPDNDLKLAGLTNNNFWRTWGVAITPEDRHRIATLIPFREVGMEIALQKRYENLLASLKELEASLIDEEIWEDLADYLPFYTLRQILDTGRQGTSLRSRPKLLDSFFSPYHKVWSKDQPKGILPSQAIEKYAAKGAFTSLEEAHLAFEGTLILLENSGTSIEAHIRAASAAYEQSTGKKSSLSKTPLDAAIAHIFEMWWLYFLILPLAGITFFIVVSAGSFGAALKSLGILFGLMLFISIIVVMVTSSPPSGKK